MSERLTERLREQSFLWNVLLATLVSLIAISPDLFFRFFSVADRGVLHGDTFLVVWLASLLLVSIRNFSWIAGIVVCFAVIEIIQFSHLAYFGTSISAYEIGWMIAEWGDVLGTAAGEGLHMYYVPVVVIVPYGLLLFLLYRYREKVVHFRFSPVLFLALLIWPTVSYHTGDHYIARFEPDPSRVSLVNSVNALTGYFNKILPRRIEFEASHGDYAVDREYLPYDIEKNVLPDDERLNIILVMGESSTYKRMSLFGYERETTPRLSSLVHDSHFVFKKGISSGVSTRIAIPFFFNLQHDPRNIAVEVTKQYNLFKLAKEQGFKTFFISAQERSNLLNLPLEYIDTLKTKETERDLFRKMRDDGLLELLDRLTLGQRNFIVLHQRNIHSTYELNYQHRKKEFEVYPVENVSYDEYRRNSYDNAMRYNDEFLFDVIEHIKARMTVPTYLFITSDHGENLGENGLWGHGLLTPDTAAVPFFAYIINGEPGYIEYLNAMEYPTHFEIGKLIADRMGVEVSDPNYADNIYFINGGDPMGMTGLIQVVKEKNKVVFKGPYSEQKSYMISKVHLAD